MDDKDDRTLLDMSVLYAPHTHTHPQPKRCQGETLAAISRSEQRKVKVRAMGQKLDNTINKGLKGIGSNAGLSCRCGANMQSQVAIYHAMCQAERERGRGGRAKQGVK